MQPIKNTRALRQAIAQGRHDFRLHLHGGAYSGKTIQLGSNGRFLVSNHIDDTEQKLTGRQLYTHSNIGKVMRLGSFIASQP